MESTGAIAPAFAAVLRILARIASSEGSSDSTQYGTARVSPQRFYQHHVAAISAAVVQADAQTILNAAATMSVALSLGIAD